MRPTRRDTPFREAMRSLLVFDGAMGSLLYERGVFVTQNFEQLNVTRPDVVAEDPRGLRQRRREGHRDQHVRRELLPPRPPRPRRPGARLQPRGRATRAPGGRRGRVGRRLDRTYRARPRRRDAGRARPGRRHLRRAGRGARRGRCGRARARDVPAPRGDSHRDRSGAPRRARHADHRVHDLRPERDSRRRVDARARRNDAARLGRGRRSA